MDGVWCTHTWKGLQLGVLYLMLLSSRRRKLYSKVNGSSALTVEALVVLNAFASLRWAFSKKYSRLEALTDCSSLVRALCCVESVETLLSQLY